MKRQYFTISGKHALMLVVRDYLIQQGYGLVADPTEADGPVFVLAGYQELPNVLTDHPVLLLSSSNVYGDRDHHLNLREPEAMDESHGSVITSPLDPSAGVCLEALLGEWKYLNRPVGRTIVIRPFNTFGPSVGHGVVHEFIQALRDGRPMEVHSPGRQQRTFLYERDFLEVCGALAARLCKGSRGIYNVGTSENVEILSLAKSIGHAFGIEPDIRIVETTERHQWWKMPALERIRVDAKWKPRYSLRSALFEMARNNDLDRKYGT